MSSIAECLGSVLVVSGQNGPDPPGAVADEGSGLGDGVSFPKQHQHVVVRSQNDIAATAIPSLEFRKAEVRGDVGFTWHC